MNGKFDRSKIKGGSMSAQKQVVDRASQHVKSGDNKFPQYFKIEEGKNIFRIAPPHNPENPAFEAKLVSWLPQIIEKDGKTTIARRPLFSATVHGGFKEDIVVKYVDKVREMLEEQLSDEDEVTKRMGALIGRKIRGKWESGILPRLSFVAYAWKGGVLGKLEVTNAMMSRIEELTIDEESDEPIAVDCFSDPNQGFKLIISYDKSKDKAKRYSITRGFTPHSIPDEDLEDWYSKKPLADDFRNSYTKSTFERVIQGLEIIDEEEDYGMFAMHEWLEIVDEFRKLVPDDEDKDNDTKDNVKKSRQNTSVAHPDNNPEKREIRPNIDGKAGDRLDDMSKEELIQFVQDNELDIIVSRRNSESTIRRAIRNALADGIVLEDNPEDNPDQNPEVKQNKSIARKPLFDDDGNLNEDTSKQDMSSSFKGAAASIRARLNKK